MKNILYIEDMEECYLQTKFSLGENYNIDWKRNYSDALRAITNCLNEYSAAVLDVNLDYNPKLSYAEQTREGLDLIRILKEEAKKKGISIPILCASSNGELYKQLALEAGADIFLWKKELWKDGGRKKLEELLND